MYRYNILPFGVVSAPSIFQKAVDSVLVRLERVTTYLDENITVVDDNDYPDLVLNRLAEYRFRIRKEMFFHSERGRIS